jgi:hypothetical protein
MGNMRAIRPTKEIKNSGGGTAHKKFVDDRLAKKYQKRAKDVK